MRVVIHENPRKFRSRFTQRASLYAAALLGGALFAHLPAANAQATSDHTAAVTTAGVSIEIDTQAWSGEPERFNRLLPVLVEITNDGEVPLRIRSESFALVTAAGERVTATPPFDLEGMEVEWDPALVPFYGYHPYFGYYPFTRRFNRYSRLRYPYSPVDRVRSVRLPTSDMIASALPEAVVEPGARATGFIYFIDDDDVVDLDNAGRVVFQAELVNAETGAPIATIEIPLVADDDTLEVVQ
jgi:hypothetical protein